MEQLRTIKFDNLFSDIKNLTWLPWVGRKYDDFHDFRILIIGDSHYTTDEDNNSDEKCFNDYMTDKNATRKVLQDFIEGKDIWKFYRNLQRTLQNGENTRTEHMWERIAFYNFIQTPMKTKDEKPDDEKYQTAWPCFAEIVKILKPTHCIFNGVRNETCYGNLMSKFGHLSEIWNLDKKINGTFPRRATVNINGLMPEILFIKHPSSRYSPSLWRDFLNKEIPGLIDFLNE